MFLNGFVRRPFGTRLWFVALSVACLAAIAILFCIHFSNKYQHTGIEANAIGDSHNILARTTDRKSSGIQADIPTLATPSLFIDDEDKGTVDFHYRAVMATYSLPVNDASISNTPARQASRVSENGKVLVIALCVFTPIIWLMIEPGLARRTRRRSMVCFSGLPTATVPGLDKADAMGRPLMQRSHELRERMESLHHATSALPESGEGKRQAEQSDALLSGIFEALPDAALVLSQDGGIVRANAEADRLFCCNRDHFSALVIEDLLFSAEEEYQPPLREELMAITARSAIGGLIPLCARRADGQTFLANVMASPLDIDRHHFVIITIRDVADERERNEEVLRESEQRFRGTIEHAPIGIAIVSLEGHWRDVNKAACELLGYDKTALQQLTVQDLISPEDIEADAAFRQRLLRGEIRSYQMEQRYIRKNGGIVPVLLTSTVLRDERGRPLHFIEQLQDISERKRTEEKLIALNERLELATRAGGIGVWDWNLQTNEQVWDERMYELYKLPKETRASFEMWRERCVYKDDIVLLDKSLADTIRDKRQIMVSEFRAVWPDGSLRTIWGDSIITYDEAGNPIRVTGVCMDVTERRQKEKALSAALREKETLLKELYHRVKNNLQVINSLFNLQASSLPEGIARTALTEGAGRVRAMALVHEKLYQSGNLASISIDSYIADLCTQLGRAASADRHGIKLEVDVPPLEVGVETAVPLGLLLNELISNSLEHAFRSQGGGRIVVHIEQLENDFIKMSVEDNGAGFPEDLNPKSAHTLGLKLVTALSRQLNGKFSLENRSGACVSIVFQLPQRMECGGQSQQREGE